ncbi:MAG: hypothetical protein HQ547_00990 [Candidatus Omnitrophica bacterium]|nr:hypothetical protein [Candidatus Omnitrophota bacterium]
MINPNKAIIILGIVTTIFLAFTSYNSKNMIVRTFFYLSLIIAIVILIYTGINNMKSSNELNKIKKRNNITSIIDRAVGHNDRESYLNLTHIVENFGPNRNAAISGISQIKTQLSTMTHMKGVTLPKDESSYTTKELIDILFFNSQYLFRGRSAQLLANRKEKYVPEALILAIFSDKDFEVVREATSAFCNITGLQNLDFFQPYHVWGYWLDNSERIKKEVLQTNNIGVIPWKKFTEKLRNNIEDQEYKYMIYWWATALEIANKFLIEELVINQNR